MKKITLHIFLFSAILLLGQCGIFGGGDNGFGGSDDSFGGGDAGFSNGNSMGSFDDGGGGGGGFSLNIFGFLKRKNKNDFGGGNPAMGVPGPNGTMINTAPASKEEMLVNSLGGINLEDWEKQKMVKLYQWYNKKKLTSKEVNIIRMKEAGYPLNRIEKRKYKRLARKEYRVNKKFKKKSKKIYLSHIENRQIYEKGGKEITDNKKRMKKNRKLADKRQKNIIKSNKESVKKAEKYQKVDPKYGNDDELAEETYKETEKKQQQAGKKKGSESEFNDPFYMWKLRRKYNQSGSTKKENSIHRSQKHQKKLDRKQERVNKRVAKKNKDTKKYNKKKKKGVLQRNRIKEK